MIQTARRHRRTGMTTTIDALEARVGRLDDSGIDYAAFRQHPLDPDTLRCLRAMHDVEFHTICYLRDLLVTPAHRDPEVTTFLTFWAFEEYWHGEAIARILAAHDEASGVERIAPLRQDARWSERLRPLALQAASLAGPDVIAVQMAWGAVNERTTQTGYGRLAARSGHPVLGELLRRIMRQEGRHIAFYSAQAQERLARSRGARILTRWALGHLWSPVGSGVLPAAEVHFLCAHLFGDDPGRANLLRIDRNIDRLPGLRGLRLMGRLADEHGLGASPEPADAPHDRRLAA